MNTEPVIGYLTDYKYGRDPKRIFIKNITTVDFDFTEVFTNYYIYHTYEKKVNSLYIKREFMYHIKYSEPGQFNNYNFTSFGEINKFLLSKNSSIMYRYNK